MNTKENTTKYIRLYIQANKTETLLPIVFFYIKTMFVHTAYFVFMYNVH